MDIGAAVLHADWLDGQSPENSTFWDVTTDGREK
jgi:hypothetical protein